MSGKPTDDAGRSEAVAVRIAGHEYKIRSDGDAEGLRQIAGYVDRAMARVREGTGTVDTLDVAVLTCLNLAREILTLREERLPSDATVVDDGDLLDLITRIEGALIDPSVIVREPTHADAAAADSDAQGAEAGGAEEDAGRTLELPSVESLRERAAASMLDDLSGSVDGGTADGSAEMDSPRVAAGGRDRAS